MSFFWRAKIKHGKKNTNDDLYYYTVTLRIENDV